MNNIANWVSYIITLINITMIIAGVASYFAEEYSVAAPFIALCSSVIINCTCFRQLKPPNFRHLGTYDSLWQAIGATGLTVAASLWLTDAANAAKKVDLAHSEFPGCAASALAAANTAKEVDLSHWETMTAWLVTIVFAFPLAVIVQHVLRIIANSPTIQRAIASLFKAIADLF